MCTKKCFRMPTLVILGVIIAIVLVFITGITLTNSINISNIVKLREKVASDSAAANSANAAQTRAALVEQQYSTLQQHHLSRSDLNYIAANHPKNLQRFLQTPAQTQEPPQLHQVLPPPVPPPVGSGAANKIIIEIGIRNFTAAALAQTSNNRSLSAISSSSTSSFDSNQTSAAAASSAATAVTSNAASSSVVQQLVAPLDGAIIDGNIESISVPATLEIRQQLNETFKYLAENDKTVTSYETKNSSMSNRLPPINSTTLEPLKSTASSSSATSTASPTKSFLNNSSNSSTSSLPSLVSHQTMLFSTMPTTTITTLTPPLNATTNIAAAAAAAANQLSIEDHNPGMIDFEKRNQVKKAMEYKFGSQWLEDSHFKIWLQRRTENGKEYGYCKICKKQMVAHKRVLKTHQTSSQHIKAASAIKNNATIDESFQKKKNVAENIKRAEYKVVGMLAVNNLSFLCIDNMLPTLKESFKDSDTLKNINMHRTKATGIMNNVLGPCFSMDLFDKLKKTFFSIIIDETTDVSTNKQIAFVVVFYDDSRLKMEHSFFDFKECEASSAKEIYQLLKQTIIEKDIPFDNLIGFAADTPNVMFGKYNSVCTHLKTDKPNVVLVKCSCHIAHLIASKSTLKIPTSLEDLLRNLGSYFNRSYLRQCKLQEFQQYFQIEVHKILSPIITRWLSLKACVDRVLEQYDALRSYLRLEVFEDPSKITESMLTTLDKKSTKGYLEFLSYALGILTDFNLIFQSEQPMLYKLRSEVTKMLQTFLSNFIEVEVIKQNDLWLFDHTNQQFFVEQTEMYIGLAAQNTITFCSQEDKDKMYSDFRNFYMEVVSQIKKRFCFEDEFYNIIDIVDPKFAQTFKIKSLFNFKTRFPFVKINYQELDNEWRQHALLDHKKYGLFDYLDVQTYWAKVFKITNCAGKNLFPNLEVVIKFLMILPFSNSSVERVFSKLKITKTDLRNKLSSNTVASILFTKEGIERNGGTNFEPTKEMLKKNWKKN